MPNMITLLPVLATVSKDNAIPTEAEIEATGKKMDDLVEKIRELAPEGVELLVPTDGRYVPAILQATTGLLDMVDPKSTETAKRALEALEMTGGGREKLN
jgi:hypothetical protein